MEPRGPTQNGHRSERSGQDRGAVRLGIDSNLSCRHFEAAGAAAGARTLDRREPAAQPSTIGACDGPGRFRSRPPA